MTDEKNTGLGDELSEEGIERRELAKKIAKYAAIAPATTVLMTKAAHAGGSGFFGSTLGPIPSDVRLKEDIAHVGEAVGHQLYAFRYIGDAQRYVGVMAQDVAVQRPDAVHAAEGGFFAVDYAALGLRMTTGEEWDAKGAQAVLLN